MKADRLLSVLMLLQAQGRATERELAERLEVSQRTVHRDLEALSMSGIPVFALRGAQGGWELEKGWRTQVPGLDVSELSALLMAQPKGLGHPQLAAAAESALNKLVASLPGNLRLQAATVRERLHVDPQGWWEAGEDLSVLPLLQEAVAGERKISFDYVRGDGEASARTVDPLGLVVKGTTWYVVAQTPKGMRTFRISRMESVTMLAGSFKRPARFHLAEFWKKSTAELEGQRGSYPALLAVASEIVQRLAMWGPKKQPGLKSASLPEGWEMVRLEFNHPEQAKFVVLGLGSRATVLEPEELGRAVKEEIQKMAAALLA